MGCHAFHARAGELNLPADELPESEEYRIEVIGFSRDQTPGMVTVLGTVKDTKIPVSFEVPVEVFRTFEIGDVLDIRPQSVAASK